MLCRSRTRPLRNPSLGATSLEGRMPKSKPRLHEVHAVFYALLFLDSV